MRTAIKSLLKRIPGVLTAYYYVKWHTFPGSADYWENRYRSGQTSGVGSYGKLAEFKAEILNRFVKDKQIASVIEFGCGDGNQLLYAVYPRYVGLDVSREAIRLCSSKFPNDSTKSFFFYVPDCFVDGAGIFQADLAISLDVLYHLVEDEVFERYMEQLFHAGRRFVIIYASNFNRVSRSRHQRDRPFTDYVASHFPQWELIETIPNRYPVSQYPAPLGSDAEFYIYEHRCS